MALTSQQRAAIEESVDRSLRRALLGKAREHFLVRNAVLSMCEPNAQFSFLYVLSGMFCMMCCTPIAFLYEPRYNAFFFILACFNPIISLQSLYVLMPVIQLAATIEQRAADLLTLEGLTPGARRELADFVLYVRSASLNLRFCGVPVTVPTLAKVFGGFAVVMIFEVLLLTLPVRMR